MKSFKIPMLSNCGIAMSLLGLCLFSGLHAPPAHADFTFGEPVNLKEVIPVIDPVHESINCFSYDGLEMYFLSDSAGGYGGWDIYVMSRTSIDDHWGPLENLGPAINTPKDEGNATISADGLTLYFESNRPGGYGLYDIYMTIRTTKNDPWGPPMNMGSSINSSADDGNSWISSDGLELYFCSLRPGGYGEGDIYVTKRETMGDPWGEPENLGSVVNSAYMETYLSLSPDGLLLLFSEGGGPPWSTPRPGGYGGCDMWMTRRASLSDPWQTPLNLGAPINGPEHSILPRILPDGSTIYFSTNSDGTWENWQVLIEPVVDFNVDGIVDAADVCIMIEHWLTDYPLCDIGPMPWGDGIVDVQDLIVLAEHLFEEFPPAEEVE